MALGEGDPTSIMKRMKMIEDQFMANPAFHDPAFKKKEKNKDSDDDENEGANGEKFSN